MSLKVYVFSNQGELDDVYVLAVKENDNWSMHQNYPRVNLQ
jgi:hypothetical protein